jgi:plasmid maintenance system killer protein
MKKNIYTNHEKSIPIQINKITTSDKKNILATELKKNLFDPFKNSPPNEFMIKLNIRCFLYHKNDDTQDNE